MERMRAERRFSRSRTFLYAAAVAAIGASFLLRMAHGICPVP